MVISTALNILYLFLYRKYKMITSGDREEETLMALGMKWLLKY
jgi:hypothetical protein